MKLFLALLCVAASFAHAGQSRSELAPGTFVPGLGCIWNETRGSCMVSNLKKEAIQCNVRVQVTTNKNQKTTKMNVIIRPNEFYQTPNFMLAWDDKIENARVGAICRVT